MDMPLAKQAGEIAEDIKIGMDNTGRKKRSEII
jgi:hypothetical protein